MKKMRRKKAQLQTLQAVVLGLVVVGLVLGIGTVMLNQLHSNLCTNAGGWYNVTGDRHCTNNGTALTAGNTYALNATISVEDTLGDVPGWLPVIVIAIIGAVVFGIIYMFGRKM